jgi:hypothetical protein
MSGISRDRELMIADASAADRPPIATSLKVTALLVTAGLILGVQEIVLHIHGYAAGSPRGRGPTAALLLVWAGLAAVGTFLALRISSRKLALSVVFGALLAVQLVGLSRPVVLSSDLYRYAWDGRISIAGIDPYRYTPVDPALTDQRDDWLFPSAADCHALHEHPNCTRINYKDAHTIYPPVAEAEFALVDLLPGLPREHRQQLPADLAALAACVLLIQLLRRSGRNPAWVTLFAWSPLVGLDLASDAHIDGAAVALSLAAFLAWQPALPRPPGHGPERRSAILTGLLLGAAVAVKLYPAILLVPFLRRDPSRTGRGLVLGSAAGVVLMSYVPHVAAVGTSVIGFLPGYLRVEGYQQGSRFLLLDLLGLPGDVTKLLAVAILIAVLLIVLRSHPRRLPAPRAALYLVGAAFLVATPVQPWYGLLLVALSIAAARPEWSVVALAAYPLYFASFAHDKTLIGSLAYGMAAVVVLGAATIRSARRSRVRCNAAADAGTQLVWTSWSPTRLR